MRNARRLASALLIVALAIALIPASPAAADSQALSLGAYLSDITGKLSARYLSADKRTYQVALQLDTPIRVSVSADGGAAQVRELTTLLVSASPKLNGKRAKASGTLVSSAALGIAGIDTTATPCALSPAIVTPFKPVRAVSIGKKVKLMGVTTKHQLTFSVKPASAERYVSWTSSNPSVLSVDATGALSANAVGRAAITARTRNGRMARLKIQVTIPVTSVALDRDVLSLTRGGSFRLTPSIAPDTATIKAVRWSSSDERVARVTSAGKVMARGAGTTTITATAKDGGCTATCLVIVQTGSGGHQPQVALDGQTLALPFTKAEAQAALVGIGWTQSAHTGGLTKLASTKYPKTAVYFDPTGQLHSLTSEDAGALVTSRGLSVGSTLKDVIAKGGTPAWHTATAGAERFKYLLPDARLYDNPLVIELLLEDDRVRQIQIYAIT